ncbi:MAG: hypothetical protein UW26_C0032G0002 [Candidatus Collierbacteria bacterium GW2011_GWF1_44_12]|uniref:Processing protease n=1 Tax=Candidatus Collierbacteria bacterium GW2011_GWF1_44_12 TaxID=1618402 RepID=A0A0G1JPU3_9BACT|nr:MAG: hypothetical protein UW26_C0032G0002 [Candidatus Collierbacteria bacterium GW2011_GWF1_44_12]
MRFEPKVFKLGKLRVVLVKEARESVTVRAMVGTGSREESDKEAGSAHFLEHFVFKGTKKYPGMYDINTAVEEVGGAFNAYTGQNEMGFWVKMDKTHLGRAVQIVGQVITEPLLPKEHFDKERGTILEELHMYEDRPSSKAAEEMVKLLYGKTNLGRPIIGTVESLNGMTVEHLRAYFEKWFVAGNIIVGVVGDYGSDEKVLAMIKEEMANLIADERKVPKKDLYEWDTQKALRAKLISRKLDQAAVFVGFRGIELTHRLRYALDLTNIILGDGWLSRLLKEVREERGWAYSIRSGTDQFPDVGDVMIGAGLPKDKLNEAVGLIVDICMGLSGQNRWMIRDEELKSAKDTFRGRFSLQHDIPEEVLGSALEDLMFEGKIYTPDEIFKNIEKVTLDEVKELSQMVFKKENMSIAVVGNYRKLELPI